MTTGEQTEVDEFKNEQNATRRLTNVSTSSVRYDLVGEIARGTTLTRKTAARILRGISNVKLSLFRNNPEEFIKNVCQIIRDQKATMIVDHIKYDMTSQKYDSDIFTQEKHSQDISRAFEAKKSIVDYVFTDGLAEMSVERKFAESLDIASEVCVYAKLPRSFRIPTPVGNYTPDWAIAFNKGTVKHVFFIAETKGSMTSMELKPIETAKINCAKALFNNISTSKVRYYNVTDYDTLLKKMTEIE